MESRLTGRIRHRLEKRLFGYKLVLQVQVNETGLRCDNAGSFDLIIVDHVECDEYSTYKWRDATVEDLQELVIDSRCMVKM